MPELKATREDILIKTEELAKEYTDLYKGCAQCTFLAAVDALRWGGLEIVTVGMEEKLYPGISLLTAGVCMSGEGTCGAVASSVMLLGLALGVPIDSADVAATRSAAAVVKKLVPDKFFKEYHSILCKDIQRKYFGKAWDLTDNDMAKEFLGLTNGCIIAETAGLTVAHILDEYEKGNIKIIT